MEHRRSDKYNERETRGKCMARRRRNNDRKISILE
jgi:hypothetical protein